MQRSLFAIALTASMIYCTPAQAQDPLGSIENLDMVNVRGKLVEYQGKQAVQLAGTRQQGAPDMRRPGGQPRQGAGRQQAAAGRQQGAAGRQPGGAGRQGGAGRPPAGSPGQPRRARAESLAIVKGTDFKNGTIELELAGRPGGSAGANARGFIGIAFHVEKSDPIRYDCFYLRPTNGRAEDQLRRNHSCQYMSHPEFPFNRLRRESPGVYESYVDLAPGEWTKVKIEVDGQQAKLFVHGSDQPCLVVNDLKLADQSGAVALWMEQSTDAYYRDLKITKR